MQTALPLVPATRTARYALVAGVLVALLSAWFQYPFWVVELTTARPSAGGVETLVALIVGLPLLALAVALAMLSIRLSQSLLAGLLLLGSGLIGAAWAVLFLIDQVA